MKRKVLLACCSAVLAVCTAGLAGIFAGAEGAEPTPAAGKTIYYEMKAQDALSEAGQVLDESVNVGNMKLNASRNELNIAGGFGGWAEYTLRMDEGYVVDTLVLDWTGRLACYLATSTTKLVISASVDGGAYAEVSSADGTATEVSSGRETLTEIARGASMVKVKFEIIWTGLDSRDWMGVGTVKLTGTGAESKTTQKAYALSDNYTERAVEGAVGVNPDGEDEIVEQENMIYRVSDGGMHLQITDGLTGDMTGYLVYRLSAGKNYGFKSLHLTIQADRISNFETSGTITINVYAKAETAENWTRAGEPFVADGSRQTLSYDLSTALAGVSDALVKYEIVYAGMAGYAHDWVRLNSMAFAGMVDLVPVAYGFADDYSQYAPEAVIEGAEEQTLILRGNDEDPPRVCLQRPTDANVRTGYIVYKAEVPNGGVFHTMTLTIRGRFLHDMSVSSGSITVNVYTKPEAGAEYVKAFTKTYQDCEESVLTADLTASAKEHTTLYVKIEIVDESGVSFSHDWVRFNDLSLAGTQTFVPYDDDGVTRYEVTYLKGGDDAIGKTPVQKAPLKEGEELTLPENPFVRSGYAFKGWKADTDEQTYEAGSVYTMTASDVRFTAVWEKVGYAVNFESGLPEGVAYTGTLPEPATYYKGDSLVLPQPPIAAEGYAFAGYLVYNAENIDKLLFAPGDEYVMSDRAATVACRWTADGYEGAVIDTSDEKYDFMGEFSVNINYKNAEPETDAYETFNVIARANDEGTATGVQLPQSSVTSEGYVTWALSAGEGKTFGELYFKFSGRVAVYESVSRASKITVLVSENNEDWTIAETFLGSETPLSEYAADISAFAESKARVYVKTLFYLENFPSYGAEWVQITAVEFNGIAETGAQPKPGKVTITYYDGDRQIKIAEAEKDAAFTPEAAPAKEGYTFEGWYTDSACTEKFADGTKVTENLSLYAKYASGNSSGGGSSGDTNAGCKGCKGRLTGSSALAAMGVLAAAALLLCRKKFR